MRKLISAIVLLMAASPVFAVGPSIPEPEVISLLGIGGFAFWFTRRSKK